MNLNNQFYYLAGLLFLAMAKGKSFMYGYTTPKPYSHSEIERSIQYDINVVEQWIYYLKEYQSDNFSLENKNILEIGPGSDLGTGLYLLSKDCLRYNAFDVNDLASQTPADLYKSLMHVIAANDPQKESYLRSQLDSYRNGQESRLNYYVGSISDLAEHIGKGSVDLVFSQASFEHIDDLDAMASQMDMVCKPGAVMVVEIDLKTHTRWIRDRDPNNIYRYNDFLYRLFYFSGIPNRLRPFQYKELFELNGWSDVKIIPISVLSSIENSHYYKKFLKPENQMSYLSIIMCARKN